MCLAFVVGLLLVVSPTFVAARSRIHIEKIKVQFLATSSLYRTTWGMDEDIYFVNLTFPESGHHTLARLINEYSNWAPPIPASLLKSDDGELFYLVRDPGCDSSYGEMILRAAPGDPTAILPEKLIYRPQLKKTPDPGEILPCYRTVEHKKGHVRRLVSAILLGK